MRMRLVGTEDPGQERGLEIIPGLQGSLDMGRQVRGLQGRLRIPEILVQRITVNKDPVSRPQRAGADRVVSRGIAAQKHARAIEGRPASRGDSSVFGVLGLMSVNLSAV